MTKAPLGSLAGVVSACAAALSLLLPADALAVPTKSTPRVAVKAAPKVAPKAPPKAAPRAAAKKSARAAAAKKTTRVVVAAPAQAPAMPMPVFTGDVYTGLMPCELGNSVHIQADATKPGWFQVSLKPANRSFLMQQVPTTTGVVRLQDPQAGEIWLQLGNKSMLMDMRQGQRVADYCQSPEQVAVDEQIKRDPPPSLLQ